MLGLEGADVHSLRYHRRIDQTLRIQNKISKGGGTRIKKKLAELSYHTRMSGGVGLTEGLKF